MEGSMLRFAWLVAATSIAADGGVSYPFTQHIGDPKKVAIKLPAAEQIPKGPPGLTWSATAEQVKAASTKCEATSEDTVFCDLKLEKGAPTLRAIVTNGRLASVLAITSPQTRADYSD